MTQRVSAVTQTHKMKANPNPKLLLIDCESHWFMTHKHPFSLSLTPFLLRLLQCLVLYLSPNSLVYGRLLGVMSRRFVQGSPQTISF